MNQQILEAKKNLVLHLTDTIQNSQCMVVVEYRGLSVQELSDLRNKLREVGATLNIYKNTMLRRAVDNLKLNELDEYLVGSNAYVFSNEVTSAPSVLAKFAKKNQKLVIKAGLIEGRILNDEGVKEVAKLPGKEGLLSMFLSCLNAPVSAFARVVNAVMESKN